MNQTSYLLCSHIHVRAVAGRTDGFIFQLQNFLKSPFDAADQFEYAELHLTAGEADFNCYWMGEDRPDFDSALTDAMASAAEIDLRLNISSETDCMSAPHDALLALLADGSLSDCVQISLLKNDVLTFSGMHRGTFLHGVVPYSDANGALPETTCWNSSNHRARFHFSEDNVYDACCIADLLPERIDMIDLEFFYDDGEMFIHSVQLTDRACAEVYREALEQLSALADSVEISGVLTPESETAFALMRFVPDGGRVTTQTAIAEL